MAVSNKKVFTNLVWRYAERFLAVLITFIVSLVLARLLTPDEYGTVALLGVIIGILEVFCTRGYNQALVQKKHIERVDYNTAFWTNLIIEALLYLAVYFFAPIISFYYGSEELIPLLRVLAIRLLIAGFHAIQQAYAQRNMLFKKFFFSTLFGTLLSGAVGVGMAYMGFGPWALVAQSLVNPLVDTIVLLFTIEWRPKVEFSFLSFKDMTPFGIRTFLMGLLDATYVNLRSLIIGKRYSTSDLGFHDKGQSIPSLVINNTQTAASNVFFSALSRENTTFDVKEKMRTYSRMMMYVLCPVMIGIACVSRETILLLFTSKWEPAFPYVIIYCFDYLTWVPIMPINLALMAIRRERVVLVISIIQRVSGTLILLAALNHGPLAIAISALIIDYIILIIAYGAANRVLKYSLSEIINDVWKTILSTAVIAVVIGTENMFLSVNIIASLVIKAVSGVIVYICMSMILKDQAFKQMFELVKTRIIKSH